MESTHWVWDFLRNNGKDVTEDLKDPKFVEAVELMADLPPEDLKYILQYLEVTKAVKA